MAEYDFTGFDTTLKAGLAPAPAPVIVEPKKREYDFTGFDEVLQPDKAKLDFEKQAALFEASFINPGEEAHRRKLSRSLTSLTGEETPPAIIDIKTAERQLRIREADHTTRASPRTSVFLSNQENAKIAMDDAKSLAAIEKSWDKIAEVTKGATANLAMGVTVGVGAAAFDIGAIPFAAASYAAQLVGVKDDPMGRVAKTWQGQATRAREAMDFFTPKSESNILSGVYSGARSAGTMIATLPVSAEVALSRGIAGASKVIAGMFGTIAGAAAVTEAQNQGKDFAQAATYAIPQAAFEYAFEVAPASVLASKLVNNTGVASFIKDYLSKEIPNEILTTLAQNFNAWMNLNPEKTAKQWLIEQPDAIAQTFVATIVGGSLQAGAVHGAQRIAGQAKIEEFRAQEAADSVTEMFRAASESNLLKIDKTTLNAFFQEVSSNGSVLINPERLTEVMTAAGVDMSVLPTAVNQLANPEFAGPGIEIPIGELITGLSGTKAESEIIQHLRVDPNSPTLAEAKEAGANAAEFFQQESDRIIEQQLDDQAFIDSASAVETDFFNQLQAVGKFSKQANQGQAALLGAFYNTLASRLGITPTQLRDGYTDKDGVARKGYKVNILGAASQPANGATLSQSSGLFEIRKQWDEAGIENFISEKNGVIDLSKIIVPKSDRGTGAGTKAMQSLTEYADRTGQRIELTPDTSFGASSVSRLVKFYKQFGFKENKGRSKDFTTSAGMIRDPSGALTEAAFSQSGRSADDTTPGAAKQSFREWFGASKVVDENGDPKPVYHGTTAEFTEFDRNARGTNTQARGAERGFFFAGDKSDADLYIEIAQERARNSYEDNTVPKGRTIKAYLKAENPLILTPSEEANVRQEIVEELIDSDPYALDYAKDNGYDAVIWPHGNINNSAYTAVVFDPDQIREAHPNESTVPTSGDAFSQSKIGSFNPNTLDLRLLADANLSTFSHELGHFFLTVYSDMAAQPDAPQSIKDDMNAMLDHLSVVDLATWNAMTLDEQRPHHEKIAESWEQYIFTGKAPSEKLEPLFKRMSAWFKQVYQSIKSFVSSHPDAKLNQELSAVFDRMLATDIEIEAANNARAYVALFKDAAEAGMTDAQFAQYTAMSEDQKADAEEELRVRGMRDLKWLQNSRNKFIAEMQKDAKEKRAEVVSEVRAEIAQRPVYLAKAALKSAKNAPVSDSTSELVIADAYGFSSVEEMKAAIKAAPKIKEEVESIADQRMIEQYGDFYEPSAMAQAADEAIHNDARTRMVATELSALAKNTGAPSVLIKAAKAYAAQLIEQRTSKTLKPWSFAAAETRAGKAAITALRKGDRQEAAAQKRTELINHVATSQAYKAEAEIKKTITRLRKIAAYKDADSSVKTRDAELVNATRAILAEFGIGTKGKSARSYLSVVRKMDPDLADVLDEQIVAATENAGDWQNLTISNLRDMHDTIEQVWRRAKRSRQIVIDGKVMALKDAAEELNAKMKEIGIPSTKPGKFGAFTKWEDFRIKLQTAGSLLRRVEPWSEMMDGKYGGPFLKYIFHPIKLAATQYKKARVVYRKKYQDLLNTVAPEMLGGYIDAPELKYKFGRGHNGIGHAELLHAILHTGNESNKRKLLLGRGWATMNDDGSMDTTEWDAFITRMHSEGVLKKAHYDFAQGVWNLLEETKPLAQKAHHAVFGRFFAEVTADTFSTPFGDYAGGYIPAVADPRLATDAAERALIERENEQSSFSIPATSKGFTKSRVENYNRPLVLDLRSIGQHTDKVLLFSHMEEPIRDVTRLLKDKDVSHNLNQIDSTAISTMLTPWLNRSARQIVETPMVGDAGISRMLSLARSRAGMSLMFANVSNVLQQLTGFSTAFSKLKSDGLESHMLRATAQYLRNPKVMSETVANASDFMADRMRNEVSAINNAINDIVLNPSLYEKSQNWTSKHAYFMQSAVDNTMGPIIWTAAYNGSMAKQGDSVVAARYADGVIRQTQGSTLPEDVSRIETGPAYGRIFTQFIGYFNMVGNTNATALKQLSRELGIRKGAGKMLGVVTLGFLIPMWVAESIAIAMRGGPDDEDGDGYLDDWIASVLGMGTIKGAFAMVPFVGQLANASVNRMNTNPADDKMSMSPAVSLLEAGAGVPMDIYKAVADPDSLNKRTAVRDIASLLGIITGLPTVAIAKPLGYAAGVADDKIYPTSTADAIRGTITGTASPESKQ